MKKVLRGLEMKERRYEQLERNKGVDWVIAWVRPSKEHGGQEADRIREDGHGKIKEGVRKGEEWRVWRRRTFEPA